VRDCQAVDVRILSALSADGAPSLDRWPTLADVTEYLEVATATETQEQAVALAASAVSARLAGNAQVIGPVISVFWHLGEQGQGEEYRVLLYTTGDRYPALEQLLISEHPWDKPQVTATPIVMGSAACLEWLRQSTVAETTP
jgi:periplasmic divalent cation tolerance protein